jgi:hypothetical protein
MVVASNRTTPRLLTGSTRPLRLVILLVFTVSEFSIGTVCSLFFFFLLYCFLNLTNPINRMGSAS